MLSAESCMARDFDRALIPKKRDKRAGRKAIVPNRACQATGKSCLIALDSRLAEKSKLEMRHIMATTKRKTASRKSTTSKTPTETDTTVETAIETPKTEETLKMVGASDIVAVEPDLKKKELIDLVVKRSQIKKKDAKPVIEAMLAVLGETIASGRELNLQPLGKLRINRSTDKGTARIIVCKLRQNAGGSGAANAAGADADGADSEPAKDSLAEVADKL
jgi:Bacterial DNA-binding protein